MDAKSVHGFTEETDKLTEGEGGKLSRAVQHKRKFLSCKYEPEAGSTV